MAELLLLMSPISGDPLMPVRDPSSAAGCMIGGDIWVFSLDTAAAAAAAAFSSLSAHAPRRLIRGGTCSPELLLLGKSLGASCLMLPFLFANSDLLGCCNHGGLTADESRGGCMDRRRSSTMDDGTTSPYFWDFCCSMRATCGKEQKLHNG